MPKMLQRALLAIGVVAFLVLVVEIGLAIAATMHGSTPARVVSVDAGAYRLNVSLYKYPANAGFALPFSIAPQQPVQGALSYHVTSYPADGVSATPVRASVSADAHVANGVQGVAEITVRGEWYLDIVVSGPAGPAEAFVPVTATASPAIPQWLGWLIGFIPFYGLLIFLFLQRGRKTVKGQ